jgi:hypothetical protein
VVAVTASFVAVLVLAVVAFVVLRPDPEPAAESPIPGATSSQPGTPTPTTSATPSVTPTPTPTPTPTRPRVTRTQVPIPTQKPPPAELPPPPPPPAPATSGPNCPQWNEEADAPPEVVRPTLAEAGARQNWRDGVTQPKGWPGGPYPSITVPTDLMNAIAFTESSWRSTVIACDKGIGLMQIMPDTAPWMNQRFKRSYDVNTVDGNAALGAMYLQWLTMYFGLYYFGSFDLDAVAPIREGGGDIRLGDVVIAAYNVGYGAVEHLHGTPTADDDTLSIPNPDYLSKVKQYLASCPCDDL